MTGGFLQLAAYGAQDIILTGNPQITFFVSVYKRYTNFSIETIEQFFHGKVDFGQRIYCEPTRIGDLISGARIRVTLPNLKDFKEDDTFDVSWVNGIGNALIDIIECEIGGDLIDRQYGLWHDVWNELSLSDEKKRAYDTMVGKQAAGFTYTTFEDSLTLYIPLQFWFCNNPGLALPLIALQHSHVRFYVELRKFEECIVSSIGEYRGEIPQLTRMDLMVDYIFLEDAERRIFAQNEHQYLITQLQTNTFDVQVTKNSNPLSLTLNHPVKEIIWIGQDPENYKPGDNPDIPRPDYFNYGINAPLENPFISAKFQFEGNDRMRTREIRFYDLVNIFKYHTNFNDKFINVYSFSLQPEEDQPAGSCNFSRIDNKVLLLRIKDTLPLIRVTLFAVSYNVLRIMKGMAGIKYAN